MENKHRFRGPYHDLLIGAAIFLAALALYLRTLAPSVAFVFDDTLEMQYVIPRLGIVHPTGYPLYTLLGKLFTVLVPLNTVAFRLNLFSAVNAALAAAVLYSVLRHLTGYRFAAVVGTSVFAVGQTFWEQAVVSEVYPLQMLLVAACLYLALIWRQEHNAGNLHRARTHLYLLALAMGLGATHHRLIVLLYPALALYVLAVDRAILKDWRTLARAAVFFLLPLTLYLYLPLRGAIGSANGEYVNTLEGFWRWVTASEYTVFLSGDPFKVQHDLAFYRALFENQFGVTGLALACVGLVWLLKRGKDWLLVVSAIVIQAAFVLNYRVADVQVHFLTLFMLVAVLLGVGADSLFRLFAAKRQGSFLSPLAQGLVVCLFCLIPLNLVLGNYATNDLSTKWDVNDYGMDILSQPLPDRSIIIGIQGEITLIRYFQENLGIRQDIDTVAADDPSARLAAVDRAVRDNRPVFLTRPLAGVEKRYSLESRGPLIAVRPAPSITGMQIANNVEQDLSPAIHLMGFDIDRSRLEAIPDKWHVENGRQLLVSLYWRVLEQPNQDIMVSLKLVDAEQHTVGQIDRHPVMDAYPTAAWRPGETIGDTYLVPIYTGTPPGQYSLTVTLYESQSGNVIGQKVLDQVALDADLYQSRTDVWNIANPTDVDFRAFSLRGFTLDASGPVRPGDPLPLTLLWRAKNAPIQNDLVTRVWLEDSQGHTIASRDVPLGDRYPVTAWQPNQYVRETPIVRVPANVADGRYKVKLAVVRNNQQLGSGGLPLGSVLTSLGTVEIINRQRAMTAPAIAHPLEAVFDNKIKLLGYDVEQDVQERGVRLTLYWKALDLMSTSYSVFVHVIDGNGSMLASADAMPANGHLPTTGWIEDEYITDIHAFTLPPDMPEGGYPIEIGLYDSANGTRLKTTDGQDRLVVTSVSP